MTMKKYSTKLITLSNTSKYLILGSILTAIILNYSAVRGYGQDSVTIDGNTYEQVKLKKEYPSSLFIEHSGGTAFIEKSKLTEDQIKSMVSKEPAGSNTVKAQSTQEISDDGYIYERDSNNNITSIRIPDSVSFVECLRFKDVPELTSVYLGKNMELFGAQNFEGPKLVKFEVSPDNPHYTAEDGVLLSKDKTALVRVPSGREGSYTTPKGVKRIAELAFFQGSKLTELVIAEGVEEMEQKSVASDFGSLTNIVVSQSVTTIHNDAFSAWMDSLLSISLPEKFQSKEEIHRIGFKKDRFLEMVKPTPKNSTE